MGFGISDRLADIGNYITSRAVTWITDPPPAIAYAGHMNKIIERTLIIGALVVMAIVAADALWALPLREWGFMACHVKGGHWLCAFDWRLMVTWTCNGGLGLIALILVCNRHNLRAVRTVMTVTARDWPTCHIQFVDSVRPIEQLYSSHELNNL